MNLGRNFTNKKLINKLVATDHGRDRRRGDDCKDYLTASNDGGREQRGGNSCWWYICACVWSKQQNTRLWDEIYTINSYQLFYWKFNFFQFSHSTWSPKNFFEILKYFRMKMPSKSVGPSSEDKSIRTSLRIPSEIPTELFSVGIFCRNKTNFQ